jgi:tetratricopeptide (TPR) repeat protein
VKAIERALFLAPNHRHALRAASRCFIHAGELDRAHSLLAKNRRTANDPWLIAAEIAAAKVANRDPKYARAGRRLLDSGHLPPDHLTELLSAMGTLEYYSGSDRRARKYLHASLEAPTDNVVAQARWLRTKVSGIAIQDAAFALPLSFEARCWRALEDASWEYAKLECQHWLFDEPFSSRPARLGSYIGISLTSDHEFSEASALAGLRTNPLDATLRNNLAVALAYQGRVAEAIEQFSSIKLPLPGDLPPFVYLATTGLLRFRSRDIVGGRELYRKAEHWAPLDMKGQVAIFHAREELEANTTDAFECVERARKMNENSRIRGAIRTLELLQERAAQRIPRNENLDIDTATHESDARLYPIVAKSNAIIESRDTVLSIPGHHASRTISVVVGTSLDPGREAGGLVRRVEPQRHRNGRPDRANEESFGDRGQSSIQRGRKGKKRE